MRPLVLREHVACDPDMVQCEVTQNLPFFFFMGTGVELQWINEIKSESTLSECNHTKDLCPAPC